MSNLIEEGHGFEDVSCEHNSRWIWGTGPDDKGAWMQVILAPRCDCGEPPRPYLEEAKE